MLDLVPMKRLEHTDYRLGEEIANSITHGIGFLLSIAGLVVMMVLTSMHGTVLKLVSCAVYGATLIFMYLSSTLYHGLYGKRVKRVFRVFDHSAIFLLIAGTYTPFTLVVLHGAWGWGLFGVVWLIGITGIVLMAIHLEGRTAIFTVLYVLMGWLIVVGLKPLVSALPVHGLLWLFAGGLCYTGGIAFFAMRRPYAHTVWHLFVMAGSACHFVAVMRYVIPISRA